MSNETASGADASPVEQIPFEGENSEGGSAAMAPAGADRADAFPDAAPDPSLDSELASLSASRTESVAGNAVAPLASSSAAAPPITPIERMEVRIDFEVGRVTLPVSSLANVAAGSVIEVPGVALDRVVAKSGGHAFAFGEFVELGGRVGFRILRLAERKEKP